MVNIFNTNTNNLVAMTEKYGTKLLDTRKTTPGIRFMEKWAVKIGGGENHRMGLYDVILIKDNHIDYTKGISYSIEKAINYTKKVNYFFRHCLVLFLN